MRPPRHRRLLVARGTEGQTERIARAWTAALPPEDVLWVSASAARTVRALLGRAFDAVVLDLHHGLDPELLGQAEGLVWGGGALVLRMPAHGAPFVDATRAALAVWPFEFTDVGDRWWKRIDALVGDGDGDRTPIAPCLHAVDGTAEQSQVVDAIVASFDRPTLIALLADRGRGKSSALGLAIARAGARSVVVTAPMRDNAAEIFRFAPTARYVEPHALVDGPRHDLVVIDEAAQLPVPLLERIASHQRGTIAFATTTRGYEGTGRGFVLRFLAWAAKQDRPLRTLRLATPIRWDTGDPLEGFVARALALDAEPAAISSADAPIAYAELDRTRLAADETLLRDLFGLLIHAHYRTTPGDLRRLLDAPNLEVHALLREGRVVAASLVAREGGLPLDLCARLARGEERIRGHALADTLISHAGIEAAGALTIARSVRIAVHPALRRQGIARRLVEEIHARRTPDLFGTLFGATPDLLRFRRSLGYVLVRLGVSRGARTGEPSAIMVRPVSPAAHAIVRVLREELARGLDRQLELLRAEGELALDPELAAELRVDLPQMSPPTATEIRAAVDRYLAGPRPYDGVAWAIERFVEEHRACASELDARARALVEARVVEGRSWSESARSAGFLTVPAAMRALRPAIAAFVDAASTPTRD